MKSGPTLSFNFGFQLQKANREARFQIHLSPGTKLLDFSRLISDFGFRSPSREEERNRGLQYRISSFRLSLGKKMEIELNVKISDFGVQLSDTHREKNPDFESQLQFHVLKSPSLKYACGHPLPRL